MISDLKIESNAIVDLIGNNYDKIIDQIFETKDKDSKQSLMKTIISLVLEASDLLANNTRLFQKIFEISHDSRCDKEMSEIILWFATSLCEQAPFNNNFQKIMMTLMDN